MTAGMNSDPPRGQNLASTIVLVVAWLLGNIWALQWLFESFKYASLLNLMLIGIVLMACLVQLWRDRLIITVSATPTLRLYPLLLMLGSGISAIAFRWLVYIPQLNLLLFLLGSYGLWGLFIPPSLWRKGLPAAILVACVVPFSTEFNSGLGFPVRVITAHAVEQMLSAWHIVAISSHDIIVMENGIAQVDLPCSGLKSLWTGTLFLLAATWLERRQLGIRWLLVCTANLVLLAIANTIRVLLLVMIIEVWQQQQIAEVLHVPLGLIGFILACAFSWMLLQTVPQNSGGLMLATSVFSDLSLLGKDKKQGSLEKGNPNRRGNLGYGSNSGLALKDSQWRLHKQSGHPQATAEVTASFAPLTPQLWGEIELKSPRIGGFRGLTAKASEVNPSENGCKTGVSYKFQQKSKSITWLLIVVIALGLVGQIQAIQEKVNAIASIQLPQQLVSEPLPLTEAEQRFFDNHGLPIAQKQRFVYGNLSGSMLLVASSAWQAHHPPELCLVGNGFKVDSIKPTLLNQSVKARWLSLQDGKRSATYWFQSPQGTTDDFLSRIWDYIAHRNKTWVLVSVLFDSEHNPDSAEIDNFASAIHDAIHQSLTSAVSGQPSAVSGQWSAVSRQWSVVSRQPSAVSFVAQATTAVTSLRLNQCLPVLFKSCSRSVRVALKLIADS
ncbi:MAG: exosortase O [Moorea sp. SIO4A1]|uniref:exosortase O n=1 Tax=Moorena sp. SIO4A1 TaxID=2607835 RepID=UPI001450C616|nr:exosortase O [Moorena sp. SIO4A1]NEQ57163.1 exosortase O [Moorena sp. SIO4A1]